MNFVINRKYITATILLISFASFAQSSFDAQFDFAKKLYSDEDYFDTVTEIKRLLFFDENSEYNYEANLLIGKSYKHGAKFSDAIRYLTLAEMDAKNIDELYETRIEIIRINILRGTTKRAFKLLDSLETDERFIDRKEEIKYWRGWAYMFADDWEQAAQTFAEIDTNHVLKTLSEEVDNDLYSVSFAKTISYIIPGAGQIYTGEYVSGLLSLGWNVLWGYLTIKAFIAERIFDGIVIANFLWLRFYRGNLQNAENFALEKNLVRSNRALNYLQFEYDGLKP
ncbi:MAG: hypothetical protein DRQ13_12100 [Ignavibacteriae bacterium]|nr:MAG: hypothetical protein DRQ13_12100 [Ignavibacteriota bacterium]